jgi:hypothetical protein
MDLAGKARRIRDQRQRLGHICGSNPCPAELKREALEYVAARREQGATEETAAAEINLSALTISRWRRERASSSPRFLPVVIEQPSAEAVRQLVVHGPCGLRVEGLDIDGLAALVRRLS